MQKMQTVERGKGKAANQRTVGKGNRTVRSKAAVADVGIETDAGRLPEAGATGAGLRAGRSSGNQSVVGGTDRTKELKIVYQPLPSQKTFHQLTTRFKGFSGPVGSGKSQALCHEAIRLSYLNPGRLGLIGAPT